MRGRGRRIVEGIIIIIIVITRKRNLVFSKRDLFRQFQSTAVSTAAAKPGLEVSISFCSCRTHVATLHAAVGGPALAITCAPPRDHLAPPPPPPAFLSQSGPCLSPFKIWQVLQHCCPGCPFQASREHPSTLQVTTLGNQPPQPLPPPRAPLHPPSSRSALLPPLPPLRVAPLLPAAAVISARACISAQPRMLVPGQREGMEASLYRLLPNAHRKSLPRSCACVFVAARV